MLREFRDSNGVEWLVWDVYPSGVGGESRLSDPGSVFPHRELAEGWLCFESSSEKRRLAPVPPGWEFLPSDQLGALCARAGYISKPGVRDSDRVRAARESDAPPSP